MRMTLSPPVIPGWSEGPDLRCAIAHRGISRFSGAQLRTIVRCFASPRNDGRALPPRLDPGPQPVDHTLGRRIAGLDDEQLLLRRLVRIDVPVAEYLRIDQLLARQI